jgi:hypothetical protein
MVGLKMDYLYLIDKKTQEHQFEIEGCLLELDKLKGAERDISLVQKIMVLKDKMMFHKGALMILADLKKELTDVTPKLL